MRSAVTTPSARRSQREVSTIVMPRFKRGIQYAAAPRQSTNFCGIPGCPVKPGNDVRWKLKLTGLGQFDFDPQFDF